MLKKILLNFFILFISVFVIFFIIDKLILFFSGKDIVKIPPFACNFSESPYGTGLKAGYTGRYANAEYDIAIRTNSLGMRDDKEISIEKDAGVYRILCVGDSFTFGQGVESNEAYPKLLDKELNIKFLDKKAEILNTGWVASDPKTQERFIKDYGVKFKPDLIILGFFAGNDIVETISEGMPLAEQTIFQANYITALKLRVGLIGVLRAFFDRLFPNLYEFLSLKLIKLSYCLGYHRNTFDFMLQETYPEEIENGWQTVFKNIENIKNICDENKIAFLLVIIPFPDQVLDVKLSKNLIRNKPQLLLKDFCEKKNISYVDMMPALIHHNKEKIYYIKDGHWTKLGHRIAAEEIFKKILSVSAYRGPDDRS